MEKTIWNELRDTDVKFDTAAFEEAFAAKAVAVKANGGVKKAADTKKQLLDPQRSQNVNIVTSGLQLKYTEVRQALLACDERILDEKRITALIKCAPELEEIEVIQSFQGNVTELGNAEQFFKIVSDVPRLKLRLELMLFKHEFQVMTGELDSKLAIMEKAQKAINSSNSLKRVLEVVLALGNYLNGGTTKGEAYGFRLQTLTKLKQTKTMDNKHNLMHFLVTTIQTHYPQLQTFTEDLLVLRDAADIELSQISSETNKLNSNANRLSNELQKPRSRGDKFTDVMSSFKVVCEPRIQSLKSRLDGIRQASTGVASLFGEDPSKTPQEAVFRIFADFAKDYEVCSHASRLETA